MKTDTLLDAIGMIDGRFIEEAGRIERKTRRIPLGGLGVIAACLVLVFSISFLAVQKDVSRPDPQPGGDLPMLELDFSLSGGMGFEGYKANDISELVNGNPWTADAELNTLPVYKNAQISEDGTVRKPDFDAMKKRLAEIAERLGIDVPDASIEVHDYYPDEETIKQVTSQFAEDGESVPLQFFGTSWVRFQGDTVAIEVDSNFTAKVEFVPAKKLPDEFHFSYDASYEDISKAAEYLKQELSSLLSMEAPKADIYGGDYNTLGMQLYQIAFYDDGGNLAERIVNYNLNRVTFGNNADGELFIVRMFLPDLTQKLGDYPIISPEEAEGLLAEGKYITTVTSDFPGREYVRKTELVYRSRSSSEAIYLPYYRIYVELPDMVDPETGMKTYGAYYVPAVEEEYISNMPLWDGSFN